MGYVFVAITVLLTVYGQLVLKWQVGLAGMAPAGAADKAVFLVRLLLNPWVLSGLGAAFAASLSWMLALSKLSLSSAYPLTASSFVLVLAFSAIVLGEPLTAAKLLGTALVVTGIIVLASWG
ncbi:EamA family transporter [Cognatilysobacter lacus]|uniref:EamA family transporter n=1 Tax=Cognatilysobacter lacus TaxID=1643323 RepID=A0A5D8Z8N6_9GAMM|nr:EamA family transporter [Lysobacter lacus]TZF91189.1 EamA family transporter [Lysobacter lacus]